MYRPLAVAVALLALVVAGCGSSNNSKSSSSAATTPTSQTTPPSSASAGASSKLALSADPAGALKFDKTSLSAKSGNVTFTMSNPADVPHGIAVEGNGVDKAGPVVNRGGKSTLTVSLKPGTYEYYCPVPGHKQAGMTGKLTVK